MFPSAEADGNGNGIQTNILVQHSREVKDSNLIFSKPY